MKLFYTCALLIGVSAISTQLRADDTDPFSGVLTYRGTGTAERAPDYGEVRFIFSINCQPSSQAVFQAISKVSGRVWNTITKQVSPDRGTETEQTSWGDISQVTEYDPSYFQNEENEKKMATVRRNSCTGEAVKDGTTVAPAFQGQQTIGVRTSNLDWLEGFVAEVRKLNSSKKDGVQVTGGNIVYAVTRGTEKAMQAEIEKKAMEQAFGPQSAYASDKAQLKFQNSHFKARRVVTYDPAVGEVASNSAKPGEAPRVTLKLKLKYGFVIETSDLQSAQGKDDTKPVLSNSEYEEVGVAQTSADYAETNIYVRSSCHGSQQEALDAIRSVSSHIVDAVTALQNNNPFTETDRYNYAEPVASERSALSPMEVSEGPNRVVTKYFDSCSQQTIDAATVNAGKAPKYFEAQQSFNVRSTNFAGLSDLAKNVIQLTDQNPTAQSAIVSASDVIGKIKDTTRKALEVQARRDAASGLLKPNSALNREAKNGYGYRTAHLVSVEIATPMANMRAMSMARTKGLEAADAPGGAAPTDGLNVQYQIRDNQTRPVISAKQIIEYDVKILTEDFLKDSPAILSN